jgi:hypothetical protein
MAPEKVADVLHAPTDLCYFVRFFCVACIFKTYFVHNVAATVSYDRKITSGHKNSDYSPQTGRSFFL